MKPKVELKRINPHHFTDVVVTDTITGPQKVRALIVDGLAVTPYLPSGKPAEFGKDGFGVTHASSGLMVTTGPCTMQSAWAVLKAVLPETDWTLDGETVKKATKSRLATIRRTILCNQVPWSHRNHQRRRRSGGTA